MENILANTRTWLERLTIKIKPPARLMAPANPIVERYTFAPVLPFAIASCFNCRAITSATIFRMTPKLGSTCCWKNCSNQPKERQGGSKILQPNHFSGNRGRHGPKHPTHRTYPPVNPPLPQNGQYHYTKQKELKHHTTWQTSKSRNRSTLSQQYIKWIN